MKWIGRIVLAVLSLGFLGMIAGIAGIAFVIHHFSQDLPDYSQLKNYEPSVITRIYAGDGRLLAEYAEEKRVFIPIQKMPDIVKQAFLSAEDKNFYNHSGIDVMAVARALIVNLQNSGSGRRLVGASTITQQVAKNFLLTNEVSYERKIKEAILAMRMEKALSKDRLLELYLNEIFLGQRAYGLAAAALTYFNKSLDELTIEEAAYLAALPKAPNNYHPIKKYQAAVDRRNWVIARMAEDGYITKEEAETAQQTGLVTQTTKDTQSVEADFFAEEVRRELKKQYGQESLYQGGLAVRSSLDPALQEAAVKALRDGLIAYDRRHGWRGPVARLNSIESDKKLWLPRLNNIATPEGQLESWSMALVLKREKTEALIGLESGQEVTMTLDGVRWARKCLSDCYALGPEVINMDQVLNKGDVILVEKNKETGWTLQQIPKVQGALIALDPHTGRVLAMQGGWTQSASSFNRATQAQRQPGSAFKPFVYLAALENGFTPASLVLDAPFEMKQADGTIWAPTNYSEKFYGPSTIRMGLEKSRNLMTVRLADEIGMDKVTAYAKKFGIDEKMEEFLSYSLGAGETTLLKLTVAYGMLVNGGKFITPTFIDRIQDRFGKTVFSYDQRPCPNCGYLIRWDGQGTPAIPDDRADVADPRAAYQIVSLLEGVIERGTAQKLKEIGRPLAGKTGTTNESRDAWFIGFSPNLVAGVFIGFDDPKSLGKRETGSSVAAPIWGDFMKAALDKTPPIPFRVPPGLTNVRINLKSGQLASASNEDAIWEVFVSGTEPGDEDYFSQTAILGTGQATEHMDDFSMGSSPSFEDGSVEIYDVSDPQAEGDNPFSYFSNRRGTTDAPRDEQRTAPTGIGGWQDPVLNPARPQPQPRPQPPQDNPPVDPNFSGTGGFY